MKWLKRLLEFFKREKQVKMLGSKLIESKENKKNNFIEDIKVVPNDSFLYKNKVETHVCNGDGLGIDTSLKRWKNNLRKTLAKSTKI